MIVLYRNKETSRFQLEISQYNHYHRDGVLKVPGLVPQEDLNQIVEYADDVLYGREHVVGIEPVMPDEEFEQLFKRFTRVHKLHRKHAKAEQALQLPYLLEELLHSMQ